METSGTGTRRTPDPFLEDSVESAHLADSYLAHGIVGAGSKADALHVALATVGASDVLVSWNFKHIVNLGKIRII